MKIRNDLRLIVSVILIGVLAGCGGPTKTTAPSTFVQPQKEYSEREISQAARSGQRIDLGVDAYRRGQLDDKDFVELNAQLSNAILSANRASALVKQMRDAEEADRIAKGLKEDPNAGKATLAELEDIKKALWAIQRWNEAKARGENPPYPVSTVIAR